jgi:hypothetical protein
MLPISIVENKNFREFISYIDPSLKRQCQEKIKDILKNIQWPNTSMDAWTDSVIRLFNGFITQGIDNDWKLHTIPTEFEYVEG